MNEVKLTDHELAVIQTSLMTSIKGAKKHIELHGEDSLDFQTKQAISEIEELYQRFNKEYF